MPRLVRHLTQWKRNELLQLFKTARPLYKHPGLDIKAARTDHEVGRLLVVTPRKIGSAPKRNKIRRRIKSIFYEHELYKHGFDWIFFIKKEGVKLSFADLKHVIIDTCLPLLKTFS